MLRSYYKVVSGSVARPSLCNAKQRQEKERRPKRRRGQFSNHPTRFTLVSREEFRRPQ